MSDYINLYILHNDYILDIQVYDAKIFIMPKAEPLPDTFPPTTLYLVTPSNKVGHVNPLKTDYNLSPGQQLWFPTNEETPVSTIDLSNASPQEIVNYYAAVRLASLSVYTTGLQVITFDSQDSLRKRFVGMWPDGFNNTMRFGNFYSRLFAILQVPAACTFGFAQQQPLSTILLANYKEGDDIVIESRFTSSGQNLRDAYVKDHNTPQSRRLAIVNLLRYAFYDSGIFGQIFKLRPNDNNKNFESSTQPVLRFIARYSEIIESES